MQFTDLTLVSALVSPGMSNALIDLFINRKLIYNSFGNPLLVIYQEINAKYFLVLYNYKFNIFVFFGLLIGQNK